MVAGWTLKVLATSLTGYIALLRSWLGRTSERDATLQCCLSTVFGSASDQGAFEFRDAGKYGQDHAAGGQSVVTTRMPVDMSTFRVPYGLWL